MIVFYDPADWFWIVGEDTTRAWSSVAKTYVSDWPADRVTAISDETELRGVLATAGCPERSPGYVPQVIALWQAREQIRKAGFFPQVDAAMQQAGGASLAAWEYGTEVRRDARIVQAFSQLLDLTEAQVDGLFVEAAKLVP